MGELTEKSRISDWLKWEEEMLQSREEVVVANSSALLTGTVLGKYEKSIPTTGVVAGTGNGTCTGVTGGAKTKVGDYVFTCVEAIADGGRFEGVDPDGLALPDAQVGTAYVNPNINFTINDGATDFVVGDTVTITVAEGNKKVRQIDFSSVSGTQDASGILYEDADASGGDVPGVAIVKDAAITEDNLIWPGGATAGQKAAALEQLRARGIIGREEG
jgi:hypothetical protein